MFTSTVLFQEKSKYLLCDLAGFIDWNWFILFWSAS
jgi:hypothetical protein